MGPNYFGLMGYVRIADAGNLRSAIDAGMKAAGFSLQGPVEEKAGGFVCEYVNPSGWVLPALGGFNAFFPDADQWICWGITSIDFDAVDRHGPAPLVCAYREICLASNTVLGRSFSPVGWDFVERDELDGRVNFLCWIQYFGPEIVAALGGAAKVDAAGFYDFQRFDNGARLAMTSPKYHDYESRKSRGEVVKRLGITPRKLMARNPATGAPIEMPWY